MNFQSSALCCSIGGSLILLSCHSQEKKKTVQPNILIAISDDQSFEHTSFAGCTFVNTPGFDRVAQSGIFFTNCYAGSPGSAPSRSSLVTGRYHWQNEQSGQHASSWMKKYVPFVDILKTNGYHTGFTGKGVDPFQYARNENDSLWRIENAAGKAYNLIKYSKGEPSDDRTADGIGDINYFANFCDFMSRRKTDQPFCFWYGATEPHRSYEKDSWKSNNKDPDMVNVPGFLPDNEVIRGDLLDYAVEIEWFDLHLTRILNYLDSTGELKNTIVIVTGDNGMPFPRAKANGYEYGVHVPLAICYPEMISANRIVDDPVSFVDFVPTIFEITGIKPAGMLPISGKSIAGILRSDKSGIVDQTKKCIFAGRERHSSSRWNNLGYPLRVIRSERYLLIWNLKPELWPAGDPQSFDLESGSGKLNPMYGIDKTGKHHSEWAFTDVDASPSKTFLVENFNDMNIKYYFDLAFDKRPEFELYDVQKDRYCKNNLCGDLQYASVEEEMRDELLKELVRSGDPRVTGPDKEIFETYIRYSPIRNFPKPDGVSK